VVLASKMCLVWVRLFELGADTSCQVRRWVPSRGRQGAGEPGRWKRKLYAKGGSVFFLKLASTKLNMVGKKLGVNRKVNEHVLEVRWQLRLIASPRDNKRIMCQHRLGSFMYKGRPRKLKHVVSP
jgi:hypothetical protein